MVRSMESPRHWSFPLTMMSLVPLVCLGRPPLEIETGNHSGFLDSPGIEWMIDLALVCWTLVVAPLLVGYGIRRDGRQDAGAARPHGLHVAPCGNRARRDGLHAGGRHGHRHADLPDLAAFRMAVHERGPDGQTLRAEFHAVRRARGRSHGGDYGGDPGRGVLQPRLGFLLSNVFWVSLHAGQYNWDGLLGVFVTGLLLGLLRKKRTRFAASSRTAASTSFFP